MATPKKTYTWDELESVYGPAGSNVVKTPEVPEGEKGLKGFATGVGKGILNTIKGAGQLGEKIGKAILPESMESDSVYSEEALSEDAEQGGFAGKLLNEENLEARGMAERLGKGTEQIAEFVVPSTKLANISKGANLAKTIATRAVTSGGVASLQEGDIGKDAAIAAGIETALPIAGRFIVRPAKNLVSRILKGTGVALSGASENAINQIVNNTDDAIKASKELKAKGTDQVLAQNVKTIVDGVSNIKRNASTNFAKGLEELRQTDIDDKVFRQGTQSILDKYGSVIDDGTRELKNVEFDDPKNIQKASDLIDRLSRVDLDGRSIRKLSDDIENSIYKTATSDERLSFNAFAKDLSQTLKNIVSESTPKLKEINKAYSQDLQLAEAIEKELGNVDYKNLSELVNASKKLEVIFNKAGLAPKVIDDFFKKIGATDLKTSEAVRQISTKGLTSNTIGSNPFEIIRNITSAVVTPKMVKNVAIIMEVTDAKAKSILNSLDPIARVAFIKSLTPKEKFTLTSRMVKNVAIGMGVSEAKARKILNDLSPTARSALIKTFTDNE